jgi:hypothetical protein
MAWPYMILIVGTICTFAFVIVLTLSRPASGSQVRERIAMIERGWSLRRKSTRAASIAPCTATTGSAPNPRTPLPRRIALMGVGFGLRC